MPFVVVIDKIKEKLIKLNLLPNYRKDVLFDQLLYLGHPENLQKYVLATGILKDSIEDSLDMIVTVEKFNSASFKRALDTKYLSVMKKSNLIVFKDKAKFDMQNLIISMLLTQIQSGKTKTEKATDNQLKGVQSIKNLQIIERLEHLKQ